MMSIQFLVNISPAYLKMNTDMLVESINQRVEELYLMVLLVNQIIYISVRTPVNPHHTKIS